MIVRQESSYSWKHHPRLLVGRLSRSPGSFCPSKEPRNFPFHFGRTGWNLTVPEWLRLLVNSCRTAGLTRYGSLSIKRGFVGSGDGDIIVQREFYKYEP